MNEHRSIDSFVEASLVRSQGSLAHQLETDPDAQAIEAVDSIQQMAWDGLISCLRRPATEIPVPVVHSYGRAEPGGKPSWSTRPHTYEWDDKNIRANLLFEGRGIVGTGGESVPVEFALGVFPNKYLRQEDRWITAYNESTPHEGRLNMGLRGRAEAARRTLQDLALTNAGRVQVVLTTEYDQRYTAVLDPPKPGWKVMGNAFDELLHEHRGGRRIDRDKQRAIAEASASEYMRKVGIITSVMDGATLHMPVPLLTDKQIESELLKVEQEHHERVGISDRSALTWPAEPMILNTAFHIVSRSRDDRKYNTESDTPYNYA